LKQEWAQIGFHPVCPLAGFDPDPFDFDPSDLLGTNSGAGR
jgi:hypothetical protein